MKRILVVEDDAFVLRLMCHLLDAAGYETVSAKGGQAGLTAIQETSPSLIITTMSLAEVDGLSLIRALRGFQPPANEIPVLLLSSVATREAVVQAVKAGANQYLSRADIEVPQLLAKVGAMLGPKDGESGGAERTPKLRRHSVYALLSPAAVHEKVGALFDMKVTIEKGEPVNVDAESPVCIANYVDEDNEIRAVAMTDFALAAHAGAALALFPPEQSAEQIESGALSAEMTENVTEVLNILTSAFNTNSVPRLKLDSVCVTPDPIPDSVNKKLRDPIKQVDYKFSLERYGSGKLTIMFV